VVIVTWFFYSFCEGKGMESEKMEYELQRDANVATLASMIQPAITMTIAL